MNGRPFDVVSRGTPRRKRATRRRLVQPARHRESILRAAEDLFSTRGFHGTTLREIADRAEVSLGSLYTHFETKERLFGDLLDGLERAYLDPEQPLPRALAALDFPRDLESLGRASSETVRRFASYIRLIYVDVIEFEGKHVRRLYGGMKKRYEALFAKRFARLAREGKIAPDVDPILAVMMATILYMYFFTVEHVFGVRRHYGLDDDRVIAEFAKVLQRGIERR